MNEKCKYLLPCGMCDKYGYECDMNCDNKDYEQVISCIKYGDHEWRFVKSETQGNMTRSVYECSKCKTQKHEYMRF